MERDIERNKEKREKKKEQIRGGRWSTEGKKKKREEIRVNIGENKGSSDLAKDKSAQGNA